ncbi:MAG TPA: hypothetical protein VK063_03320 [Beutenbergiaceae bacterium]|nr:hypothetical protein [Beutenbergiaceae bacterium]
MKRLFWIGVGVAGTVAVLRKVQQASDQLGQVAHAVSPRGIAESVTGLADSLKTTATQLRASMAAHEVALTQALLPSEEEQARSRVRRSARPPAPTGWDDSEDAFF